MIKCRMLKLCPFWTEKFFCLAFFYTKDKIMLTLFLCHILQSVLLTAANLKVIEDIVASVQVQPPVECEAVVAATLIAAAIGAAITGGVAIANAAEARRAKKSANRRIAGLNAENSSNYYRDYYRSVLDNDASRAYLKKLDERMEKSDNTLSNTAVATGATHENALASKQGRNEVASNAISNIVADNENRKERMQNQYLNRRQNLEQAKMESDNAYSAEKQQNLSQMGAAASQAASAVGGAFAGGGAAASSGASNAISSAPVAAGAKVLSTAKAVTPQHSINHSFSQSLRSANASKGLNINGLRFEDYEKFKEKSYLSRQ